jgi:hypothetical protein
VTRPISGSYLNLNGVTWHRNKLDSCLFVHCDFGSVHMDAGYESAGVTLPLVCPGVNRNTELGAMWLVGATSYWLFLYCGFWVRCVYIHVSAYHWVQKLFLYRTKVLYSQRRVLWTSHAGRHSFRKELVFWKYEFEIGVTDYYIITIGMLEIMNSHFCTTCVFLAIICWLSNWHDFSHLLIFLSWLLTCNYILAHTKLIDWFYHSHSFL